LSIGLGLITIFNQLNSELHIKTPLLYNLQTARPGESPNLKHHRDMMMCCPVRAMLHLEVLQYMRIMQGKPKKLDRKDLIISHVLNIKSSLQKTS
jgi:hypothetical protein